MRMGRLSSHFAEAGQACRPLAHHRRQLSLMHPAVTSADASYVAALNHPHAALALPPSNATLVTPADPPPSDEPQQAQAGAHMPRPRPRLRTLYRAVLLLRALVVLSVVKAWRHPQPQPPPLTIAAPPAAASSTTSTNSRRGALQQHAASLLGLLLCTAAAAVSSPCPARATAAPVPRAGCTVVILGGYRIPAEQYRVYAQRLEVRAHEFLFLSWSCVGSRRLH